MSEWKETKVGRVPSHWEVLQIGDFSNVTKLAGFEYTKFVNYVEDGAIIALRALNVRDGVLDLTDVKRIKKEVSDNLIRSKLFIGDILLTYVGANIGQFALIDEDDKYHLAPNICRIRVGEKCDFYYLYSYFRTLYFQDNLINYQVGSSQPTMPMGNIRKIRIPLPPLPEQRAIASVLSSLDDKINLLHRQNKTLEAMAETLFKQWFVEEADEGWEEGTLGDVASFHNGKKRPDNIIEGNIPIYGGNGILGYANKSNYGGVTVIIGRVGAYCGSLYIERNPVWISDNALVAKPINKEHPSFLLFLLKSLQLINEMAEGSSHPLLTQTLLKSTQIILPPERLIESFVYQADTWLNKIDKNNKQISTLEKLRDTLLPKLMSGEVRVGN